MLNYKKYEMTEGERNAVCCVVECGAKATWVLYCGPEVSDITDSCDQHVTQLIDGRPLEDIERLSETPVWDVEVRFDGPPSMPSPRFIDVVASNENTRARGEKREIKLGEWVDNGDGTWSLRFPLPEHWVVG